MSTQQQNMEYDSSSETDSRNKQTKTKSTLYMDEFFDEHCEIFEDFVEELLNDEELQEKGILQKVTVSQLMGFIHQPKGSLK